MNKHDLTTPEVVHTQAGNELKSHLGQYVFLIVEGGRSFPCHVLRVTETEVLVQETDHDEFPLTMRRVPLGQVVHVVQGDSVDEAMKEIADPSRFVPAEVATLPCGAAEVFTVWRGELNSEDLLAHPLEAKTQKPGGTDD